MCVALIYLYKRCQVLAIFKCEDLLQLLKNSYLVSTNNGTQSILKLRLYQNQYLLKFFRQIFII
jgi:hypothetical protein